MRWTIGDVEVIRVEELQPVVPFDGLLRGVTQERLAAHRPWLLPHFVDPSGDALMSIHAFVVRSEGQTIVVDTCIGDHKIRSIPGMSDLSTGFLSRLKAAGCPPASVDTVLCTHLHFDHVGWNTRWDDGRWVPTFPRARYLFGRLEWEHWSAQEAAGAEQVLDRDQVLADSVRPVLDAGLADLVETDHRLTGEVWLEPTPGHTPGHVSVRIASGGAEAVVTGDAFHHPVQVAEPGWGASADTDAARAAATRREFVARHGRAGTLVLGTHFAPPTAGRIRPLQGGWWFDAAAAPAAGAAASPG